MPANTPERPNFILLFPDQWRGDCLGALGHPVVETPYLDFLASEGTLFTSAYTASPSCIPARACLATGQTPSTCNRLGYQDGITWNYPETMMNCLRDGGYQTFQSGKTHFYPQRAALGFEEMRLYDVLERYPNYDTDYHRWLRDKTGGLVEDIARQSDPNTMMVKTWEYDEELHSTNWIVNSAIELVARRDPMRPFFLQVGIHRPHSPYDPPTEHYNRYRDRPIPPCRMGDWAAEYDYPAKHINSVYGRRPTPVIEDALRAYYASITHIDYQIGKLHSWLRVHGQLDNTYIIFTSDHGDQLGDHCMFRKATPFEGSAKIPFFVVPPPSKKLPKGRVCDLPVTLMDIMPTLLEEAGVAIPSAVEGLSLSPLIRGQSAPWRDYMHGEHANADTGWHYVTDGKEKFAWDSFSGREYFFDLVNDPTELRNLVSVPDSATRVSLWRSRLVETLAARPQDGLVSDSKLVSGKILPKVRK